LWETFELVVSLSDTDTNFGYLSLNMMNTYLSFNSKSLEVTYQDFWDSMSYFLYRRNKDIVEKHKLKGNK
jgi:hypothetical protein